AILTNLVDWALAFLMFVVVALLGSYVIPHLSDLMPRMAAHFSGGYQFYPHLRWLWLPVLLFFLFLFVSGLVFVAAAMQVYFRDVSHLINLGLFLWLFVTPILYPLRALSGGRFTTLLILNPLTGLMDGIQLVLLQRLSPWENHALYAAGFSVVLFVAGYCFFKHEERYFADVV
ncbi:hypothetical protein HQ520_11930, partial [bacterium]|nr:hypothetical protein [bacterium]